MSLTGMTYRDGTVEIRFVCMVCLAEASATPAVCGRCGVALSDGDAPELGHELLRLLRQRALSRPAAYERRRMAVSITVAAPLALLATLALVWIGLPLPRPSTTSGMGILLPALLLWFVLTAALYSLAFRKPPIPWPEAQTASLTALVHHLGIRIVG